jgi:hypothetical protein
MGNVMPGHSLSLCLPFCALMELAFAFHFPPQRALRFTCPAFGSRPSAPA